MILDSFMFNSELDMLEFRLKLLWDHVDKFILVESDCTHSGKSKPCYFQDNLTRFEWAKDKTVYRKLSLTYEDDPWRNENRQRAEIIKACGEFSDDDLLIISDLDEIPSPQAIRFELDSGCPTRVCEQYLFYFNLRTLRKELWRGSIFCRLGEARKFGAQYMRDRRGYWEPLKNAGWHLSYFGDVGFIRNKLEAFAHQECNTPEFTNEQHIRDCMDNGLDLFKRGTESLCPPPGFFPDYFREKARPYGWGLETDAGRCHKETGTTVARQSPAAVAQATAPVSAHQAPRHAPSPVRGGAAPSSASQNQEAKPAGYYSHARRNIADLVPGEARRILDIGCGHGHTGALLRGRLNAEVVGVEMHAEVAKVARKHLDAVLTGDIEAMELPYEAGHFDCIILGDVLEHLVNPWKTLKKLVHYLADDGSIVASIPNIRNLAVIRTLLDGSWRYVDEGILDRTHLRFFALNDMRDLFEQAGVEASVKQIVPDPRFRDVMPNPWPSESTELTMGNFVLKNISAEQIQELTAVQFIFLGRKKKGVPDEAPGGLETSVSGRAVESGTGATVPAAIETAAGSDPSCRPGPVESMTCEPGPRTTYEGLEPRAENVLIIDRFLPEFDREPASMRLFWLLGLLKQQRCHISFFATEARDGAKNRRTLEQMGVEVYEAAPGMLRDAGDGTGADPLELKRILASRGYSVAWLASHEIASRYLPALRSQTPATAIAVDAADIGAGAAEPTGGATALEVYKQADALITASECDRLHVESYLPGKLHAVFPSILPAAENPEPSPSRSGLLFAGDFNHEPNADAVSYFIDEVFPLIQKTIPDITLWVVGSNPPDGLRELRDRGVIVTGNVPSAEPYLRKARVFVAPFRRRAGMKGKIAEAMAFGLPVVTTSVGAGEMVSARGKTALIADAPEEFAKRVVELYSDDTLWQAVAENSRLFIEENHSAEHVYGVVRNMMTHLSLMSQCKKSPQNRPAVAAAHRRRPAPAASIIIAARNRAAHTSSCLQSIKTHTTIPHEIILVDNNSSDQTLTFLRHWSGENANLKVIVNNTNRGFATANNQGLALASGKYIVLLNNDTLVTAGWLEGLINVLEKLPGTGMAGPVSNNVSRPQLVEGTDYRNLEEMELFAARHAELHTGQTELYPRLVAFCLAIESKVVDKIGGFDERFGLGYYEDDDFCLRAWLSGYRPRIARDVFIHHAGSITVKDEGLYDEISLDRNWGIFTQKWGFPPDSPRGLYTFSKQKVKAAPTYIPLPDLSVGYAADSSGRFWCETGGS